MEKNNFMNLVDCEDNSDSSRDFRNKVNVVCVGDSITGYNNWDDKSSWISQTYPEFLPEQLERRGKDLVVANCGMAGELSDDGLRRVERFLAMFPKSRYFVIGYGTNDLANHIDVGVVSESIVTNIDSVVEGVFRAGKKSVLLNVPYVNEICFPVGVAAYYHERRDFYNSKLAAYASKRKISLVDICSKLQNGHYFIDELHPNISGAKVIAGEVADVLAKNGSRI
ncbi:MAG: SGNH/GDSL hydrolase family protein [archaeon]